MKRFPLPSARAALFATFIAAAPFAYAAQPATPGQPPTAGTTNTEF